MKKQLICFTTAAILALGATVPAMAAGVTATPNDASVAVDGKGIAIGAYNIGGYNYFKLRDVAAALNGTGANFEVGYDAAAKSIALSSKTAYSATGNELKDTAPTAKKTATVSNQKIILDGAEVSMQAYLIDGYNYFQLRELGKNLGFEVAWDNAAKAINMVTSGTPAAPSAPKEEVKAETDVEKLQKAIDSMKPFERLSVGGTFKGNPGDVVTLDKPLALIGDGTAVLENITLVVNTVDQIRIENITFEGNKKAETAMIVKNAGDNSIIEICTFQNYLGDAVVIDQIVDNGKFYFAGNNFIEFGLAEKKVDGAIVLNATKKATAYYELDSNVFKLSKDIADENKMDVAFKTNDVANAVEIYSNTKVAFINNTIDKANTPGTGIDMYSDISSENVLTDYLY
ncbi:MAG: hypothetical protein II993_02415 [Anaerotignum sp.]|nr:hypothetical protein [Anaerotignum sp.]